MIGKKFVKHKASIFSREIRNLDLLFKGCTADHSQKENQAGSDPTISGLRGVPTTTGLQQLLN